MPTAWHRRTTHIGTSCVNFAAVSSCLGRRSIQKAKIVAQERVRMCMCANTNDTTKKRIK